MQKYFEKRASAEPLMSFWVQSLVDQLASVGISNPILILESLQVPIHDDRLNIHEVRQILDASIRDHPMSSIILGTIAIICSIQPIKNSYR